MDLALQMQKHLEEMTKKNEEFRRQTLECETLQQKKLETESQIKTLQDEGEKQKKTLMSDLEALEIKKKNIENEIRDREKEVTKREENHHKLIETAKEAIKKVEERILLNIGGKLFHTTKSTLCSQENIFFGLFSSGQFKPSPQGDYFFDRNPEYFDIILEYLRGVDIEKMLTPQVKNGDPFDMEAFVCEWDYYLIQVNEEDYELEKKIRFVSASMADKREKKVIALKKKREDEEKKKREDEEMEQAIKDGILLFASTLLNLTEQSTLIEWTGIKKPRKLLYKATRDGFQAAKFHQMCDNKGPTLVVIQSSNGYVFGGYAAIPWTSVNKYVFDQKCFLFSAKNANGSVMVKMNNDGPLNGNQHSIYDGSGYGPTWGGGHDLYICDSCNTNASSYSSLGHSYSLNGYTSGSSQIQSFLAGSKNFTVSEIEVFGE